ncbi:Mitochondrial enolase superfamily member 1 isoform 2 [Scophthalmus maximus]|uniref:Mitochondrial enolase superfamily member 1 isoform 2 n=1 Tax=Scophthalmus maximus TaxID=52904 RepID=A0A2U9CKE3_SCOMX|nr:Mitochondrial enolase superfamily member 1 isoform 2 [Scophthalmus maximus]
MLHKITRLTVRDVRFPTSSEQHGSDAMHSDPDYSAAYVVVDTDCGRKGFGLTFTLGKGTDIVVCAVEALAALVVGKCLQEIVSDFRGFYRLLTSDGQMRWLGPEKGVIHLATAAVLNAVWDLWARVDGKVGPRNEPLFLKHDFLHKWMTLPPIEQKSKSWIWLPPSCAFTSFGPRVCVEGIVVTNQCHNRVMFKQFLQASALQFVQIDSCRLGSVNENLAVMLMAHKFQVPVCPHAGGVGLCELVQHLILFDYICLSASLSNRMCEYVDHLHEHFTSPVVIQDAHYMPPKDPGYSCEMLESSVWRHQFPEGDVWKLHTNK